MAFPPGLIVFTETCRNAPFFRAGMNGIFLDSPPSIRGLGEGEEERHPHPRIEYGASLILPVKGEEIALWLNERSLDFVMGDEAISRDCFAALAMTSLTMS
jgi:hypothetical protein